MKPLDNPAPEAAPRQSTFGKVRNRLATCLIAGAAIGCATPQQAPPALSAEHRSDIREDVIAELQKRKMCDPFEIELERKQVTRIGLSSYENKLVDLLPSHDAVVQRMLLCYPEKLRNKDYALDLLKRDIRVARFLHESMLSSPEFMLQATYVDKRILDYGRPALFENPGFIMAIVKIDPENIRYAFPYQQNNPGLFVKMMKADPAIMDHLPKYISSDADFMESVGYFDPRAYLFNDVNVYRRKKGEAKNLLTSDVWNDKEYAEMVADSKHFRNLKYFSSSVRADVNLMGKLMKTNPKAYHYRHHSISGDESLMRAWLQTKYKMNTGGTNMVRLKHAEIDALMTDLKELDIEFPDRFTLNMLYNVISQRKGFQKDLEAEKQKRKARMFSMKPKKPESEAPEKTPITLQIAAKADWNGAFTNSITDDFIIHGQPILYFETGTSQEAFKVMDDMIMMKQPVNHLAITGHGSKERIALGAPDPRLYKARGRRHYFDRNDWYSLRRRKKLLTPDARIIFQSCSVGEGASSGLNIANTFHSAFPQARIYASKVPTNIKRLTFGKDGAVADVIFASGAMSTYRRHPKEVNQCLEQKMATVIEENPDFELTQEDLHTCRRQVFNPESQKKVVSNPRSPAAPAGHQ